MRGEVEDDSGDRDKNDLKKREVSPNAPYRKEPIKSLKHWLQLNDFPYHLQFQQEGEGFRR